MASSKTAVAAAVLLLALLSLAQGPRLCNAASRHDCLKVDFRNRAGRNTNATHPHTSSFWNRLHNGMNMPFCDGSFWVSLNTTQLFKEVGLCHDDASVHAPAPAGHGKKTSGVGGNAKTGCSSSRSTRWAGDGYDVAVDQVKGLESALEAIKKRACSKWVEVPTASHKAGEKVLVCAECPAAPPVKRGASMGRRGLAGRSGAFIIIIIIFLL